MNTNRLALIFLLSTEFSCPCQTKNKGTPNICIAPKRTMTNCSWKSIRAEVSLEINVRCVNIWLLWQSLRLIQVVLCCLVALCAYKKTVLNPHYLESLAKILFANTYKLEWMKYVKTSLEIFQTEAITVLKTLLSQTNCFGIFSIKLKYNGCGLKTFMHSYQLKTSWQFRQLFTFETIVTWFMLKQCHAV